MKTGKTDMKNTGCTEARKRLRTVIRRRPSGEEAAQSALKAGEKLRVAAYRRVGPDDLGQVASKFLLACEDERRINTQASWLYVGSYIDTGNDRTALERLMDAARSGEVDRIEEKSMQVFASNVGELLKTVCALRCLPNPVQVHFEAEDVTTGAEEWERCVCFLMSCLNMLYRKKGDFGHGRMVEVG